MNMRTLEELNTDTRSLLNQWHTESMMPRLKLASEKIPNVSYQSLKNFKSGINTTYNNLYSILRFLESQGYTLKEKVK